MTPFYFGTRQRRLFGIFEPAQRSGARAAVLCHPWGAEYLHAHRSLRQLARLLTAAGFHTLRFDYYGTGDSAGNLTDADLPGWVADIEQAADELQSMTATSRVTLIGLRLGAALAAEVATRPSVKVDQLVLWDPVICGQQYLAELQRAPEQAMASRGRGPQPAVADDVCEVAGFSITREMAGDIGAIDVAGLMPDLPRRTLVLACARHPSHAALQAGPDGPAAAHAAIEYVPSNPAWVEWPTGHVNVGTVPANMLRRIVELLQ